MRRLLITGGAGFIGANFVRYWLDRHSTDHVVVLDALTYAGHLENLAGADKNSMYRFVQGDIRDGKLVEDLLATEKIDTIVHLAAESHVDRSISGPEIFVDVNIRGTQVLLDAARRVWLEDSLSATDEHRFHHVSTDEVYGSLGPDEPAFSETTSYAPNSPYAASKAGSDHLVRAYHHTYGLRTTMTNCSNNYGPYQFPEKLIPLCILNLLEGKDLPIYGDGQNVRDWLHVEDHCRGIELVLEQGRIGETYNIGTRNELNNLELVNRLCDSLDGLFAQEPGLATQYPSSPPANKTSSTSRIRFVRDRPGHDQRYAINSDKIEAEFGFTASVTFEQGLEQTIQWYVDNHEWCRSVTGQSYSTWIDKQYRC
jgi:dTDP-glucose 4,6-dehydratase